MEPSSRSGDAAAVGRRYLDHLSHADLVLLAGFATSGASGPSGVAGPSGASGPSAASGPCGASGPSGPAALRADPAGVEAVMRAPAAFEAVFDTASNTASDAEVFARVSPFLAFAVAVQRACVELRDAVAVDEWIGPRRRLPVLGAAQLADFLADPWRRLFLAELLASYTHVAGGTMWVPTGRGWRRRRISELDPVQLASLIEVVPEAERPGVYRRLGDLALFLTGVFPDSSTTRQFPVVAQGRLLRASGVTEDQVPVFDGIMGLGRVGLLEYLGERWYRLACGMAPATAGLQVVADIADRFGQARRTLNLLTDRYLFPLRGYWSDGPAA